MSSDDASFKVELSVDGHNYSAELLKRNGGEWTLLSVEVDGVEAEHVNRRAASCFDALRVAEVMARRMVQQLPS